MQKQREHWSSRFGFLMAAAGSAIGLGTLWKFPYVTGNNGGGLFVLIYIACTFLVGIPAFIAELILGRHSQRGAVGTFTMTHDGPKGWSIAGWLGVASSFFIMSYYSVIAGWGLSYMFMMLNEFYVGKSPQEISAVFDYLASSGDITIFWHLVFTSMTVAFVYPGIRQGIEYWSRIMTSALLCILLCLFFYATTLDGFSEAIHFLFYPDLARFKPSGALEALGLSLFTLSLGQGIMITYGSYMRRGDDIPKTGLMIGFMDIAVSLIAGMTIFPIIFTFGFKPEEGEGLVFKVLPALFSQLPGSHIVGSTFFMLFVFTAFTSAIALVEVVSANFIDLFGWTRKRAVITVGASSFVFGIPSALSRSKGMFPRWEEIYGLTFFETIDQLVSVWLLPIGVLLIVLYSGWRYNVKVCKEGFTHGSSLAWLWHPWRFFLRYVAPVATLLIFLQRAGLIDIDKLLA